MKSEVPRWFEQCGDPARPRFQVRNGLEQMRRVLKIGALSLALRIFGLLASFLMGVLLARILGPADYGIYGLITTLVGLAMTAGVFGTPHLAVRDLSIFAARGDSKAI